MIGIGLVVTLLVYLLPIALTVLVVISLRRFRSDLTRIYSQLEAIERLLQSKS